MLASRGRISKTYDTHVCAYAADNAIAEAGESLVARVQELHARVCIFAIVEYCTISRNAHAAADTLGDAQRRRDVRRGLLPRQRKDRPTFLISPPLTAKCSLGRPCSVQYTYIRA